MKTKVYATYLRVSTQKQGQTQLGLSSQRSMCEGFIKEHNGELAKEFLDIESGTHRNRKGLWGAIEFCNKNHCPLVIATLSRLARDVEFCFKVINTGIEIHFVDMPTINTLLLGVFASVAQYERELTSDRTKKALAVKKAQGVKLGAASDNYNISSDGVKKRSEKSGSTRTRHTLESRDVVALIRIMKKVFPKCANHKESEWESRFITTRKYERNKVLSLMVDYKSMDESGKLFAKWDLSDFDNTQLHAKLASKLHSIIKMLAK